MTREGPNGILFDRFLRARVPGLWCTDADTKGPLDTVQLIGRWGSDAIKVYVQEAPLHRGDEFHRPDELTKPEQVPRNGGTLPRDTSNEVLGGQFVDQGCTLAGCLRVILRQHPLAYYLRMAVRIRASSTRIPRTGWTQVVNGALSCAKHKTSLG